ncbi:MAG: recombinase family protein [Candidatus Nanopelagicales bacterium]
MDKEPRAAIIYTRMSLDKSGEGLGVERQETECRALCKRLGWDVVAVHEDNDISAISGKARPGWQATLQALSGGEANALVGWAPDRFMRRPRDLEDLLDIIEGRGVQVATVTAGAYDLSTPGGRLFARTMTAFARMETDQKSERQKAQERQRAYAGVRRQSGARPFGWLPDRVNIDPVEGPALRQAILDVTHGKSLRSLIAEWNADPATRPSRGGEWHYSTIRELLQRPANAGLSVYQGEVVPNVVGDWLPIVTLAEHEAICAVLRNPARRLNASSKKKYFLAGVARCGVCDAPMNRASVNIRGKYRAVYRCRSGANHGIRSAVPIDEAVVEHVLDRLSKPDAADLFRPRTKSATRSALAEIERTRARLTEVEKDYAEGTITGAQFKTTSAALAERLSTAQAALAIENQPSMPESLRKVNPAKVEAVWASLSVPDKSSVADALLSVTIYPTSDPEYGSLPYGCLLEWK